MTTRFAPQGAYSYEPQRQRGMAPADAPPSRVLTSRDAERIALAIANAGAGAPEDRRALRAERDPDSDFGATPPPRAPSIAAVPPPIPNVIAQRSLPASVPDSRAVHRHRLARPRRSYRERIYSVDPKTVVNAMRALVFVFGCFAAVRIYLVLMH